jgi:hypothetical protein
MLAVACLKTKPAMRNIALVPVANGPSQGKADRHLDDARVNYPAFRHRPNSRGRTRRPHTSSTHASHLTLR